MVTTDFHEENVDIQDCLLKADGLKLEGNDHFRLLRLDEALVSYRSALGHLPRRKEATVLPANDDEEDVDSSTEQVESAVTETEPELSPSDLDCAKARAVLNANIGACHMKLGEHKGAVEACTEALRDDPSYVKALQRRATCNEVLDTWSSLTSAQEDYSTLLKILPENSTLRPEINKKSAKIKPRLEAAQKRETDEMLGKLKGLGNSILGNFGLSTDNFQFTPNGGGGYSMSFNR